MPPHTEHRTSGPPPFACLRPPQTIRHSELTGSQRYANRFPSAGIIRRWPGVATPRPAPTPTPAPADPGRPRGLTPGGPRLCRLARRILTNSRCAPAADGQTAYGEMAALRPRCLCPVTLRRQPWWHTRIFNIDIRNSGPYNPVSLDDASISPLLTLYRTLSTPAMSLNG